MADRIGTQIAGYRVESLLSRGGMGEVYLAEQDAPRRKVALKLLSPELSEDPGFRERFARESEAAASVDHPNVIPIYASGQADGALFIAMRYVEGTDLHSLLAEEGRLRPERAVHICAQIADALEAAHERGLVHRDVKPANILVGKADHAYLSDFGLIRRSEVSSGITRTGQFMGTIDYVAPEQIKGEAVDGRADVYSLGCVLYECLIGEPPFRRDTEVATLYAHLEDPPPMPSTKAPTVPPALDAVVARSMAKVAEERFATAGELGVALNDAVTGNRLAEQGRISTRKRMVLSVAGAVIAVGVILAIVALAGGEGDPGSAAPSPVAAGSTLPAGSIAEIDAETGEPSHVIRGAAIGAKDNVRPNLAIGEGGVWLYVWPDNYGFPLLQHFDQASGEEQPQLTIPGVTPAGSGLVVDSRTVWFSGIDATRVSRINPATHEALEPVSIRSGVVTDIILGDQSLWVGSSDGTLTAFNPLTGRRRHEIKLDGTPDALAYSEGSIWVLDSLQGEIIRVDPVTERELSRISLSGNLKDIAAGDGGVWVLDTVAGTATQIDPSTDTARSPIGLGATPTAIAVGLDSAWVTDRDGNLYRIDPELGRPTPITLGTPLAVVAIDEANHSVWVGAFADA
jgi:outer membrane protein assembly factor BamB/predicted Ser/Thr protein kinase